VTLGSTIELTFRERLELGMLEAMSPEHFLDYVYLVFLQFVQHEAAEAFTFRGVRTHNPHRDERRGA
jgi:hypothetical protein